MIGTLKFVLSTLSPVIVKGVEGFVGKLNKDAKQDEILAATAKRMDDLTQTVNTLSGRLYVCIWVSAVSLALATGISIALIISGR